MSFSIKQKLLRVLVPVVMVLVTMSASAETHSGYDLFLFGDSPVVMGRGGTGVAEQSTDMFFINPASIAFAERYALSLNYGTLQGTMYNPALTAVVPTAYGVLGVNFRFLHLPDTADFSYGYNLSVGFAKDITSYWSLGASLNMVFTQGNSDDAYIGLVLGSSFYFPSIKDKSGFGLIRPSIGVSINGGVPIGPNWQDVNFNTLTIGYSFTFFEHKYVGLRFFNDLSMIHGYTAFPVKLGLEIEILKSIYVRGGAVLPSEYDYGDGTIGIGYRYNQEDFSISANYSLSWYKDNTVTHYLGVNMEYGIIDREPPGTKVKPDQKYISPNYDGVQDDVTMELEVLDGSRITGWYLKILDDKNNVVREYKPVDRDVLKGLTVKQFFLRLVQRKNSLAVPARITWDGKDNKGNIVKDGKYQYRFSAWDERGNVSDADTGPIIVDTVPPEVTLEVDDNYFSPNGDRNKDRLRIKQKITMQPGDVWKASFVNEKGDVVRNLTWKERPPYNNYWDGKGDDEKDVPEGLYSYRISSQDLAGNRGSAQVNELVLTRKYETADISSSDSLISLKKKASVRFFPRISTKKDLVRWEVVVKGTNNKPVKIFSGQESLDPYLQWELKDQKGKPLEDGTYTYQFQAWYRSGNNPASFEKKLVVDSTPPELDLSSSPSLFSPDDDGENDVLTLKPRWKDQTGIDTWTLTIYSPSGDVFKRFRGHGAVPETIKWDGLGDKKDLVESAADYYGRLRAVDLAGNRSKSSKEKIPVDILVVVTERGLKMRVSNITFRINSARITGRGTSILRRVNQILGKYRNYDVVVEGHTDSIGSEEYNMELSERRARAVRNFLVKRGVSKDRLRYIGMGESTPLYPNNSNENRRRNRRVEFLLVKKNPGK